MAMETASDPTAPSAQLIGHAFVQQYYHILHYSPELVHRFYQDSSFVSRPDSKGEMTTVTTMQGINEIILSLNFKEIQAEIKTAEAQKSYKEGVTVLVTGCLTAKDNKTRSFAQSFFLAPQEKGYFVLNDVFTYIEDHHEPSELHPVNGDGDEVVVSVTPEPEEPIHASDSTVALVPENSPINEGPIVAESVDELSNHLEEQKPDEIEEDPVEPLVQSNGNADSQATKLDSSSAQENVPKKSYASVVKVQKASGPAIKARPNKTESRPVEKVESAVVPKAIPEKVGNSEGEGEHTIYIRNFPISVTAADIKEGFKQFGPIKPGGIHVRKNKQGYCFGFLDFQYEDSIKNAIQASPVTFAGCQVVVEMKRGNSRAGNGTGNPGRAREPSSRRVRFRSDNNRAEGRGNYAEGYQQGRARGPKSSAPKPNAAAN